VQRCKIVGNVPERSDGAAMAPSDRTYMYRGGSWGNRIDKTSESLRAHADGDQLIFKGSLLPFDTVPDDGGRERRVSDRPP